MSRIKLKIKPESYLNFRACAFLCLSKACHGSHRLLAWLSFPWEKKKKIFFLLVSCHSLVIQLVLLGSGPVFYHTHRAHVLEETVAGSSSQMCFCWPRSLYRLLTLAFPSQHWKAWFKSLPGVFCYVQKILAGLPIESQI